MRRQPLDPNWTNSPEIIVLSNAEIAALDRAKTVVDQLYTLGYEDAAVVFVALIDLRAAMSGNTLMLEAGA